MIRKFENPAKLFSTFPISDLKIFIFWKSNFFNFLLSLQILLKQITSSAITSSADWSLLYEEKNKEKNLLCKWARILQGQAYIPVFLGLVVAA